MMNTVIELFIDLKQGLDWCKQYGKYLTVGAVGTSISAGIMFALTENGVYYMFSFLISAGVGSIINFTLNKKWTFKPEKDYCEVQK